MAYPKEDGDLRYVYGGQMDYLFALICYVAIPGISIVAITSLKQGIEDPSGVIWWFVMLLPACNLLYDNLTSATERQARHAATLTEWFVYFMRWLACYSLFFVGSALFVEGFYGSLREIHVIRLYACFCTPCFLMHVLSIRFKLFSMNLHRNIGAREETLSRRGRLLWLRFAGSVAIILIIHSHYPWFF